jgi:hypothetical protein
VAMVRSELSVSNFKKRYFLPYIQGILTLQHKGKLG